MHYSDQYTVLIGQVVRYRRDVCSTHHLSVNVSEETSSKKIISLSIHCGVGVCRLMVQVWQLKVLCLQCCW